MSGREMRFRVPPKTFRLDGRITQQIGQWVQNRRTGDWESQMCCDETAQYSVCDGWPNADVGGRKLRNLARSSRRGTLELGIPTTLVNRVNSIVILTLLKKKLACAFSVTLLKFGILADADPWPPLPLVFLSVVRDSAVLCQFHELLKSSFTNHRSGLRNIRTCSAEQGPPHYRGPHTCSTKFYDVKLVGKYTLLHTKIDIEIVWQKLNRTRSFGLSLWSCG